MARPRMNKPVDLSKPADLTEGIISRLTCPSGKKQGFLRDSKAPGLRVRVTTSGAKAFVFETKLKTRKNIRHTIGDTKTWSIKEARKEANRLRVIVDKGQDPREHMRLAVEAQLRSEAEEAANTITVGEAWKRYMKERESAWGTLHYGDHVRMVHRGGIQRSRMPGVVTKSGPLVPLLDMRLSDLDSEKILKWARMEAKTRPARVRLALRMLKAFLRWASDDKELSERVDPAAASGKKIKEAAGKPQLRKDNLQKEQLKIWFYYVGNLPNPVISAYLQVLLLIGARREELAELKWVDINFRWKGITLKDKVEETRQIPLTPYVTHLLHSLPRRNEWVFSSPLSKSGRLREPSIAHRKACQSAGLELSLHGLRRSFKSLTEWQEVPVGVVAQIMGHKPSATAEKNYTVRPLDLLRIHHEKIEAWVLEQASVSYEPAQSILKVIPSEYQESVS